MAQTKSNSGSMNIFYKFLILFAVVGIVLLGAGYHKLSKDVANLAKQQSQSSSPDIINATFKCSDNKTIAANFFDEKVEITLSDDRTFLLLQGLSGSGVRYTNDDESVTFWNKGNTAFLEEGNNTTYNNCVQSSH